MHEPEDDLEKVLSLETYCEQSIRDLHQQFKNYEQVHLAKAPVDMDIAKQLPENIARRLEAVAISYTPDGGVVVVMANPTQQSAVEELSNVIGRYVTLKLAGKKHIERLQNRIYEKRRLVETLVLRLREEIAQMQDVRESRFRDSETKGSVVAFLQELLSSAVMREASDIHMELSGTKLRVRIRIDGLLSDVVIVEEGLLIAEHAIRRLKVMADLDISQTIRPVDGRFRFFLSNHMEIHARL